jgi:hypothetical protein
MDKILGIFTDCNLPGHPDYPHGHYEFVDGETSML